MVQACLIWFLLNIHARFIDKYLPISGLNCFENSTISSKDFPSSAIEHKICRIGEHLVFKLLNDQCTC